MTFFSCFEKKPFDKHLKIIHYLMCLGFSCIWNQDAKDKVLVAK